MVSKTIPTDYNLLIVEKWCYRSSSQEALNPDEHFYPIRHVLLPMEP